MGIKRILERITQRLNLDKYVKTEPIDLIEYDLLNFNEDLDKSWEKINALYDKVLYKDNYWHLFYEGEFSTLRCSPEYMDEIEKFFKRHEIESKCNGKWADGSPTVEKYKNIYRNIFHEFSVLAICLDEVDLFKAADRICHAFFNHHHYMAKEHRKPFEEEDSQFISPIMWEAEVMSRLTIYRAHYVGRYDTERYIKKVSEERKNNLAKSKKYSII
jgi:hypothetical protein